MVQLGEYCYHMRCSRLARREGIYDYRSRGAPPFLRLSDQNMLPNTAKLLQYWGGGSVGAPSIAPA